MSDIASSVVQNFSSPCPHDKAPTIELIEYHKKSNVVHQLSYGVEFTGVNTSALILGTFQESE